MFNHMLRGAVLLCACLLFTAKAEEPAPGLDLTAQQRAWLKAHPTVVLGLYANGWSPSEGSGSGRPAGFSYDLLSEAARRLGVRLGYRTYRNRNEMLQAACANRFDVVMDVTLTAERTRCFVYTQGYLDAPIAIVGAKDDERVADDPDLAGLRLVTVSGWAVRDAVMQRYPAAEHLTAASPLEALRMVAARQADAYLGDPYEAGRLIEQAHLERIALIRPSDLPLTAQHFGVPSPRQPFAEALDAALDSIPQRQKDALRARWLPPLNWGVAAPPEVSPGEALVLAQPLRVGVVTDSPPISFLDQDGSPDGLVQDYLRRFRERGANVRIAPMPDWHVAREAMRLGQLDALMGVPDDALLSEREWLLSEPFLTLEDVIVTRERRSAVLGLASLDGRRVLVADVERLGPIVLARAPHARMLEVQGPEQALALVRTGEADAYVGNLATVDRLLRGRYAGELRIAAPAGTEEKLSLAVQRKYAPLVTSFNRMLTSMTEREREAIRDNWLASEDRSWVDLQVLAKWLLPVLLIAVTAALVHGVGHLRLRREVKERRRVERRLREVSENLPAVVYQAELDEAGAAFRFLFVVGDVPALFGISAEQILRDPLALGARIHPEDLPGVERVAQEAAAAAAPIETEFRALSPRGWRWVRTKGLPQISADGELLWSGYWIDVTEAHEQSLALVAAKVAAEEAAAARADFLTTMSHEIRTPMSGVLGMLDVLDHMGLGPAQRRVLSIIDDSAQMLRQILDDILDSSKIEAGALVLEPTPISLGDLVENVRQLLVAQAGRKGLQLSVSIDGRVWPHHLADGVRLRQILFNLLSNAIKFTEHGTVAVSLDALGEGEGGQQLRLSVADTGIGIAQAQQALLFRPFSQAQTSIARRYGGSGLGLSICRRLVDMMGGSISLQSQPGMGARVDVVLTLPAAEGEELRVADAPPVLPVDFQRGLRVLVIEDHPTNQAMMRWRMERLGLECRTVDHGEAGLAALREEHFDLVITDCHMPGMDGYTFVRTLRERERAEGAPRKPVLAVTASTQSEDVAHCIEAGMDECLVRPVPFDVLRLALQRWLPVDASRLAPAAEPEEAFGAAGWPDAAALVDCYGALAAARLVETLRLSMHKDLDALEQAMKAEDAAASAELLHRIAGAVATAGASQLAECARSLRNVLASSERAAGGIEFERWLAVARDYLRHLDAVGSTLCAAQARGGAASPQPQHS